MHIELREMTSEEFPRYADFSFKSFVKETAVSSKKSIEDVLKFAGGPPEAPTTNDIWRVICSSGLPIGYIWIHILPEKGKAFGYDIFLDEGHRSQGVGRKVMEKCRILLRAVGIKKVEICVFHDNQIARHLYESLGFKEKSYDQIKRQFRLEAEV